MEIRTLIVDDEPLARERLAGLLARSNDVSVVGECGDGKSAVALIKQEVPDLVLLDIQLPELNGFDILEALPPEKLPAIIFVTAYDQFAVKAFGVHAVDYLLKPVENERLAQALDHLRALRLHPQADSRSHLLELIHSLESRRGSASRILLRLDNEIVCLKPSEIDWVESAGNYACFHVGSQTWILRKTMNFVEQQLAGNNFLRIHRTAIVNLDRIRRLKPLLYGDYEIELRDGTKLPMSRAHRQSVLKKLESQ